MFGSAYKNYFLVTLYALFLFSLATAVLAQTEATSTATESDIEGNVAEVTEDNSIPLAKDLFRVEGLPGDRVFGDFVLGPGKVELSLQPGESRTVLLDVANRTGESRVFYVDVEDMGPSASPNQALVLLGDDTGPYSLKDYISVDATQFIIEHNTRALVPVTVTIPENAEPGGFYGSVLVKTTAVDAKEASATNPAPVSAIVSRIGTLFFVTVPGDVDKAGRVENFSTLNNKKWFTSGPINFGILYENTGSVHLNPYGELRVSNMFGEEIGFLELEPWFTLPQSTRLRELSWNREMLYGRYTATIAINRGYDDIVDELSYTFWVVPVMPLVIGFALLFTVLFLLRAFFRKFEFRVKTTN